MQILRLLTLLTTSMILFSGCLSGKDDPPVATDPAGTSPAGTTDPGAPPTSPTSGGSGGGGGAPENVAPTATLTASVPNGTIPLNVTFMITASDADGDALSWTLDANGDGRNDLAGGSADLPASEVYSYTVAGVYNVTLEVSDGEDTVRKVMAVTAEQGAPQQHIEADWDLSNPACAAGNDHYDAAVPGEAGTTYASFVVNNGTRGLEFKAEFFGDAATDTVLFLDEAGAVKAEFKTGLDKDTWTATGVVPADAVTGIFYGCAVTPDGESVVYDSPPPAEPAPSS